MRERGMAEKILESPLTACLYCSFAMDDERVRRIEASEDDFEQLARLCAYEKIDLTVVTDPKPLSKGLADYLRTSPGLEEMMIVAPDKEASRLEWSKEYARDFMSEAGVPSPRFMPVDTDTLNEGLAFLDSLQPPYVLKADGLAEGRGVYLTDDLAEAKDLLEDMVTGIKGESARHVLIDEYVAGRECTVVIATDGNDYRILPPARDYKRLLDGDQGPNTPGMGAYSPVDFADATFMQKVEKRVIIPTLRHLNELEIPYRGFLYFGLVNLDGEPVLLEYNVRPGDPEMEVSLRLMESDLVELLCHIARGGVSEACPVFATDRYAVGVVLTDGDGRPRDIATGEGNTLAEAAASAYARIPSDSGLNYRKDIGKEEI